MKKSKSQGAILAGGAGLVLLLLLAFGGSKKKGLKSKAEEVLTRAARKAWSKAELLRFMRSTSQSFQKAVDALPQAGENSGLDRAISVLDNMEQGVSETSDFAGAVGLSQLLSIFKVGIQGLRGTLTEVKEADKEIHAVIDKYQEVEKDIADAAARKAAEEQQ